MTDPETAAGASATSDPSRATVAFLPADATDEEAAAIVAALEVGIPRTAVAAKAEVPRWRFSGRWWTKPVPSRRDRP